MTLWPHDGSAADQELFHSQLCCYIWRCVGIVVRHSVSCILHSAFFIGLAIRFSIDSRCEEAMTTSVESVVQKEIRNQRCSKKDEMTDSDEEEIECSARVTTSTVQFEFQELFKRERERERTFEYGTNGHILLFFSPVTLAGLARQNEQT